MHILIIEDEPELAEFLRNSLEAECFAIDVARDGEQGSFLARTNEYDLIILDKALPFKNGREVCEETRLKGKKNPILILSVDSDTESKVEMLNSGADDYLVKPFSFNELLARIRALLRRPLSLEKDILKIDTLILDKQKQQVIRDDQEIYLTRKEFSLLEYMMKNQGILLTRGMITEHVWNMDVDTFSNTIESHIRNLRNKIDKNSKKHLIHTVSGRGYRLDIN